MRVAIAGRVAALAMRSIEALISGLRWQHNPGECHLFWQETSHKNGPKSRSEERLRRRPSSHQRGPRRRQGATNRKTRRRSETPAPRDPKTAYRTPCVWTVAEPRRRAAAPQENKVHTVSLDTCYVQACAARQPRGGAQEKA